MPPPLKPKRTNWKALYHKEVIRRMAMEGKVLAVEKQLEMIREQLNSWKR